MGRRLGSSAGNKALCRRTTLRPLFRLSLLLLAVIPSLAADNTKDSASAPPPAQSRFKPIPLPAHANPLGSLFGNDLLDSAGNPAAPSVLDGQIVGLYFSASWCPPCRAFSPVLVEFAEKLRAEGKPFTLVLVGCDPTRDAALEYMNSHRMPGYLVPPESDARKRLERLLDVEYIPQLVVIDSRTRILDYDGLTTVQSSPAHAWSRWNPSWAAEPSPDSAPAAPPADAWTTATWSFTFTERTTTARDLLPERRAFWHDFLTPAPAGLEDVLDPLADALFAGRDAADPDRETVRAANRALLDRLLPEGTPEEEDALPHPWLYAANELRSAIGHGLNDTARESRDRLLDRPLPDDAPWQACLAAAFSAAAYTDDTRGWSRLYERERRETALDKAAEYAGEGIARLAPEGTRARILLDRFLEPPYMARCAEHGVWNICETLDRLGVDTPLSRTLRAMSDTRYHPVSTWGCWEFFLCTPGGRETFAATLDNAERLARSALEAEPAWPAPCRPLIVIAALRGEPLDGFLGEALARQADYEPVVDLVSTLVSPTWFGSVADKFHFVRALAEIPRTDTPVPFSAWRRFGSLCSSQPDFPGEYAAVGHVPPMRVDPAFWPVFRDLFERYLADPASAVPRDDVFREYLVAGLRFGDAATPLDAWDRAGCPPVFAPTGTDRDRETTLLGPARLPGLRAAAAFDRAAPGARTRFTLAVARRDAADADAALSLLRDALPTLPDDVRPAAADLLAHLERGRTIVFDWEPDPHWHDALGYDPFTGYEIDSYASIKPAGLTAWHMSRRWDPGRIQLRFSSSATANAPLDLAEISADYRWSGKGKGDARGGPEACIELGPDRRHGVGVLYAPLAGTLRACVRTPANETAPAPFAEATLPPRPTAKTPFRLRLRVTGGRLDAWLDGAPVFENLPLPDEAAAFCRSPLDPAFGSPWLRLRETLHIDRIRFRRASDINADRSTVLSK
ncbi:MAG: hypothetical protein IKQ15_12345 [Kiritimatiellae bacterium]|nr:hypothetical protein [Kiritimatiellia bacterium]